MWKLFLLSAAVAHAQFASMACSNVAAAQTTPVAGPSEISAVLKISTADDYSKVLHTCRAEYELVLQPAGKAEPAIVKLHSSDADWGRPLAAHLDGFSGDGKRLFATVYEEGRSPTVMLFQYDAASKAVKAIDLKKVLKQLADFKCSEFAVAGTTASGAIILKPDTGDKCLGDYRWQVDPASGDVRRLPKNTEVIGLFQAAGG